MCALWRLDGLRPRDLNAIAELRNSHRELLRSPGFTHPALQVDWLRQVRQEGGEVAAIRRRTSSVCCGYVALYPRHGTYAELGWLTADYVPDETAIALGVQLAHACGLRYLMAEPSAPTRDSALRSAGFSGTGLMLLTL